jgi:hypothetical protein
MTIQQQLYHEIETLPLDAQEKVLKMVHFLGGIPGTVYLTLVNHFLRSTHKNHPA